MLYMSFTAYFGMSAGGFMNVLMVSLNTSTTCCVPQSFLFGGMNMSCNSDRDNTHGEVLLYSKKKS